MPISLRAFVKIEGDEPQNSNFSKDIHHFSSQMSTTTFFYKVVQTNRLLASRTASWTPLLDRLPDSLPDRLLDRLLFFPESVVTS